MKLASSVFEHGGIIPSKYTCDGENISSPLQISGVPAGAKSLVLIMDDPDIPEFVKQKINAQIWDHWVVFNIPADTTEITEGQNPPGVVGKNTGGDFVYSGPCPPDREHRYFFKLYALDTALNLPAGAAKTEVEKAMFGHVLDTAELVGKYKRVSQA